MTSNRQNRVRTALTAFSAAMIVFLWAITAEKPANATSTASSVKGLGSAGYIAQFQDSSTIGNSTIYETSGNVGIGTTAPLTQLDVVGSMRMEGAGSGLMFSDGSVVHNRAELIGQQGPTGPTGPQGPSGISHVYATSASDPVAVNGNQVIASLSLPAGNYLVTGKMTLKNRGTGSGAAFVGLYNDTTNVDLAAMYMGPADSPAAVGTLPVQAVITLTQTTTVSISCQVEPGYCSNTALSAVAVDQVN